MMNNFLRKIVALCVVSLYLTGWASAQNWPQWRGPEGNGIAGPGEYPGRFDAQDHLLWKTKLPGAGGSTPLVWEDRIILTSGVGEGEEGEDGVLCYDWKGQLLWEVTLGKQIPGKHPRGSGSSPSAVTDGERIFVLFKTTTLAALDFDGRVLWKINLRETYGEITFWWDFGTSPVLAGGNLVVAIMHEGASYLLALDTSTGKEVWKTDRTYTCSPETAQSYTTPLVVKQGNKQTLVIWGADHLTGHDVKTGKRIWSYSGFNPGNKQYWRTIASPVVSDGLAVVPFGRGRHLAGMRLPEKGNLTSEDWLWELSGTGTDVATPVARDGKVYVLGFGGKLWCLNLHTGEELWQTSLPNAKGMFYSSPTLAGNRLYMTSDEGSVFVVEASETGITVLTHVEYEDHFVATPVLVQDKLLLRGTNYLYCIAKQSGSQ